MWHVLGVDDVPGHADAQDRPPRPPARSCEHVRAMPAVDPRTPDGCEECLEIGASWIALRLCRTCGHVGCCNDSEYRHAEQHYQAVDHPVVTAYRSTDAWGWCYEDEVLLVRAPQT